VPYGAEREADMSSTEWIESAGGPLVVLPASVSADWKGVAADDYDEACGVEEYLGLLTREWGHVLVLGDEPLRTAVVKRPEGPAIVRWMYAPSAEELLDAALKVDLDAMRPVETITVGLRNGPYAIFDSGADGSSAKRLEFTPPPGARMIRTYVAKDDAKEIGMILHRFGR
jgi:hypothetical protein